MSAGFTGPVAPCQVVARERARLATMIQIRSLDPLRWEPELPVITSEGLIGRLHTIIDEHAAWVELLTAPDLAVGVEFERTGLVGVLRPRAGRFVVELVGRDEDVLPGDEVITSGLGEVRDGPDGGLFGPVPRGLRVGKVDHVSAPSDQVFKEIEIAPHASFRRNETVYVVGAEVLGRPRRAVAMRHFLRTTVAWVLLAFLGENLIAPVVAIKGIAPDFTVIAVVILAMAEGARAGAVGGFALGLVQDLAVPTLLGLHAFCKSAMGWVLGVTRGRLIYGMPLVELSLLMVASLSHDTIFLMVQSRQQSEAFLGPWLREAVPTAVYTALAGWPLIRLSDLLGILRRED